MAVVVGVAVGVGVVLVVVADVVVVVVLFVGVDVVVDAGVDVVVDVLQDASSKAATIKKHKLNQITLFFNSYLLFTNHEDLVSIVSILIALFK